MRQLFTILFLMLLPVTLPAQLTAVHNGTTTSYGVPIYKCGSQAPGHFSTSTYINFVTPQLVAFSASMALPCSQTGSVVFAIVSLGYDSSCSTQMSTVYSPGSTGLLIADPFPPNYLATITGFSAQPCTAGIIPWQMSLVIDENNWPAFPGWTFYIQMFEYDSNGDIHAQAFATEHTLYAF